MAETHAAASHGHEEEPPEFTVPQGVQMEGVPGDYEEKDINIGSFLRWMGGLGLSTAIIIALLYGAFQMMLEREREADVLPSPLFARRQIPPPPRLLPNQIDYPVRPNGHVPDPPEIGEMERASENAALAKIGLLDEKTGLPMVPDGVAQQVIAGNSGPAPAGNAPGTDMNPAPEPSDASGGTALENPLR